MPQFEPSAVSLTPNKKALRTLRYMRKAIDALEAYVSAKGETEDMPTWFLMRIHQGGCSLGVAMNFLSFQQEGETKKKKKGGTP